MAIPADRPVLDAMDQRKGPAPARYGPTWGELPEPEFAALLEVLGPFTATAGNTVRTVWEGWGGIPDPPDQQRAQLTIRRYLMLRGDLGSSGDALNR